MTINRQRMDLYMYDSVHYELCHCPRRLFVDKSQPVLLFEANIDQFKARKELISFYGPVCTQAYCAKGLYYCIQQVSIYN